MKTREEIKAKRWTELFKNKDGRSVRTWYPRSDERIVELLLDIRDLLTAYKVKE